MLPSSPLLTTPPSSSFQESSRSLQPSSWKNRSGALASRQKISSPRQNNPTAASSSVSTIASSKMSSISASFSLPANTAASSALTLSSLTERNPATKKVGRPTPSAAAAASALIRASTSSISFFGCLAQPNSLPAISAASSGKFKLKIMPTSFSLSPAAPPQASISRSPVGNPVWKSPSKPKRRSSSFAAAANSMAHNA